MSDNITPFDRYARPSAASEAQDNTPDYKAFGIDKSKGVQASLRILYHDTLLDKDAMEETMPYPLARVIATSHQYITIYCTDGMVIILEGRNLKAIMEPLQDGHVRYIQRFHEGKFAPPEPDAPVIERITRQTISEMMGR